MKDVLAQADSQTEAALARLFELIRIPSVSTDPAHAGDCAAAADWLVRDLTLMGAEARAIPTLRHPMVLAHLPGPETTPHVLFYGHYDVQPPGDPALWSRPPFEPSLTPGPNGETHINGRGASDDKGAMMTFLEACRAWIATRGGLPLRVSVLIEGEEESGSASLAPFLAEHAAELRADAILACDSDQWDAETPAITVSTRGICSQEITVTTADRDLHSGIYGNAARNALTVLCDLLAGLRGPDGGIAIDGFHADIAPLDPSVAAAWERLHVDEAEFLGRVGLSHPAGEAGRSVLEQVWARPSCDIHGVWGGYTEPGFKTVIPREAHAKLSFRLAPGQDPDRIRALFQAHIRAHLPPDASVAFTDHTMGRGTAMPVSSPWLSAATEALEGEWGGAALIGMGGTIPILPMLKDAIGAEALLVGFASLGNRIHAPDEKYDLSSFTRGTRSWVRIIDALSRLDRAR
ncbi:M20/M25/M40 family metallo-hydrolase [Jannaschia seohaensis]|uniref:Acetylornithine deacetylase/Succinyl-diaminopimelate desuccinylase n=1 Tax=Jannaschia seohaensis TaxID=475081 RepID=A0A2Y9A4N1_9RHOB|nr:M20/M25/M40 family metallo-hydrolase [Jannaschia seohaensis]PWJ22130.1 acetylornithine deacetylase/succinyl-diaminopimelate desuccinylase-like protein [Jannaschia seohaensis]SSA38408.1 Acetylornithine deacetylase/Succinyl-diaminopimelate desuccinylase [Jannaschia seohaensis]